MWGKVAEAAAKAVAVTVGAYVVGCAIRGAKEDFADYAEERKKKRDSIASGKADTNTGSPAVSSSEKSTSAA